MHQSGTSKNLNNRSLIQFSDSGGYEKQCHDSTRLNSLKILVFRKFPLGANEDKKVRKILQMVR